ncbi:P pilus assembly chaperone PapD [Serratia fonticola]|jgi:chaperone protein PapD|uniref:P pilus assembly chaperone PapD n=1 Tax=Serratia fonticola TaxID=47917 RepID=A0A542BKM8_SERFO|nr:fimbria/pilus periplasmic chaperone [Serratia fonticola]TQI79102.1 P pilus assembly chaperone PapD [Serratia fonticola]TQI98875.1 P pilus assembly chaperone PapD [Serratia fonticola]TVZ68400.1 P pilus assembly chaperone PapD [Serratia fonticola]
MEDLKKRVVCAITLLASCYCLNANAALTIDRSRLVFNEGDKSVSINVANRNTQDPYLAQVWLENEQEQKISGPLMILPPVQRIEPNGKTLVRVQALADLASLPKDRESVYWFNLREIPPKNEKANVLTLAVQTRLKVFYRPKALAVDPSADTVPGTETLTLTREGSQMVVNNPTPYHFTFVELRNGAKGNAIAGFDPDMVAPKGTLKLNVPVSSVGNSPALIFVNDYGSQRLLPFTCTGNTCKAGRPENPVAAPNKPSTSH